MKSPHILPPTLLAFSILAMLALHFLLPLVRIIPSPWNYFGLLPIVFGSWWNIWADQLFKKHQTTVKPHLKPTSLVSSGPFSISRNPMYVGMVAIEVGIATVLGTLTPMFVPVLFVGALSMMFLPAEEKSMEETFGESWKQYKNAVRRWL